MATLTPGDSSQRLTDLGVEFHTTDEDDVPDHLLALALEEGERQTRGEVAVDPPAAGQEFEDFGAWHVNDGNEAHFLRSGTGQVQFVDDDGVITVDVEAGDVMIIRGAEHRFRALTPAVWVLHFAGVEGADLVATQTGRQDSPWD
jgi:mannose-6-phosphate isomerase-like protein (cupin superfamily)